MYSVVCAIYREHATHISRTAVCEMYFAGQVHRDAYNRKTQDITLASLSICLLSPFLYSIYFSIVLSLYLFLFLQTPR